jgi:hypothetical protein
MPEFVMVKLTSGTQAWVNADLVRYVYTEDNGATSLVRFDDNHAVTIQGPPAIIVNAGKGRVI